MAKYDPVRDKAIKRKINSIIRKEGGITPGRRNQISREYDEKQAKKARNPKKRTKMSLLPKRR